jgi:uncharacterized membrane protein
VIKLVNTLLLIAVILGVTIQQMTKKSYNLKIENGAYGFGAMSSLMALIVFMITSGGNLDFKWSLVPYSFLFAISYTDGVVFSILAIVEGPLALTSLMIQYSLMIPTIYGFFGNAKPSVFLVIGIVFLLVSLVFINLNKKGGKGINLKWGIYAFLAFLGNGFCSTFQMIQQDKFDGGYKSEFMIIALIISIVVLGVAALCTERKGIVKKVTTGAHWYIICGLANGLVNLFMLFLANYPASIVFPVVSAGGIVTTALAGIIIYREKLSVMQIIGMVLGTASIVFLNL